jgi:hypothetical protein
MDRAAEPSEQRMPGQNRIKAASRRTICTIVISQPGVW